MYALTPGKGIFAHREPNGVLHTYVTFKKPREWVDGVASSDRKSARARVAQEFKDWAPELVALIADGETPLVARSLHVLPQDQHWDHVAGVTLLGDAAHLNPPDGEGANWAMYDGAELEGCSPNTGRTPKQPSRNMKRHSSPEWRGRLWRHAKPSRRASVTRRLKACSAFLQAIGRTRKRSGCEGWVSQDKS